MNSQKIKLVLHLCSMFLVSLLNSQQQITLDELREAAIKNSSQGNQEALATQTLDIHKAIAKINLLPKLSLGGSASYQTDVTTLPISFPGVEIPSPQNDQYKINLDLQQTIYDGGLTKAAVAMNEAAYNIDLTKVIIDQQKLWQTTDQLFFVGLALQVQQANNTILEKQLNEKRNKVLENIKEGTSIGLSAKQLQVRLIELSQHSRELGTKLGATKSAINILTGNNYGEMDVFEDNLTLELVEKGQLKRPEIKMLEAQQQLIRANEAMINSKYTPKLSLAASLAYGRPGLNFLSRDFDTYGIGSVNLRIPLDHFYTKQKVHEHSLNKLKISMVDDQILNATNAIKIQEANIEAEIINLQDAIIKDQEILNLRQEIANTIEVQYDNGVITEREYLEEMDHVLMANNTMALHKIQLSQAVNKLYLLIGKF